VSVDWMILERMWVEEMTNRQEFWSNSPSWTSYGVFIGVWIFVL